MHVVETTYTNKLTSRYKCITAKSRTICFLVFRLVFTRLAIETRYNSSCKPQYNFTLCSFLWMLSRFWHFSSTEIRIHTTRSKTEIVPTTLTAQYIRYKSYQSRRWYTRTHTPHRAFTLWPLWKEGIQNTNNIMDCLTQVLMSQMGRTPYL
jgi:hypothetical protein